MLFTLKWFILLYIIPDFLAAHHKGSNLGKFYTNRRKTASNNKSGFSAFNISKDCPKWTKFGQGPPEKCPKLFDPLNKPKSRLENWFTTEIFYDLFPKANLGWGPHQCFPYSYESFIIAARYFPFFGTEDGQLKFSVIGKQNETLDVKQSSNSSESSSSESSSEEFVNSKKYKNSRKFNRTFDNLRKMKSEENWRRDLASFFAHAVQETGENDASLYNDLILNKSTSDECFYRGGFFNWFEGGPVSSFLPVRAPGLKPSDGNVCHLAGLYCVSDAENNLFYPCNNETTVINDVIDKKYKLPKSYMNDTASTLFKGCYFGRGVIQISYNFNYGQFQQWLFEQGLDVDLLNNPNLVLTKRDPPLAFMASLWFYMTPQPPKPAMHDIVIGNWEAGELNRKMGYAGPIFGPTSLVINNECGGEDKSDPGGPGESRRIKAFKFFCKYFNVPPGPEKSLTCAHMPQPLASISHALSYQPDWPSAWREAPCECSPATYGGTIAYYAPGHYPNRFAARNEHQRKLCLRTVYARPDLFGMSSNTSRCLNFKPEENLTL